MKILLLGSGGREHALAWKIAQSPLCSGLFIAPGNGGTGACGTNVKLSPNDFDAVLQFARAEQIGMVVVGPEEPLVHGIYDHFAGSGIMVIGPSAAGARLEGSKDFSKQFMQRHGIPTAAYAAFTADTYEDGLAYLRSHSLPIVLKADGLAAGKGVVICQSHAEAETVFADMLLNHQFGSAGSRVVVEQFLTGIEVSVFVLTDGRDYAIIGHAKDYKRIGEGDTGPNTGGMGCVSPVPFAEGLFMQKVVDRIIEPTIRGLHVEALEYKGFVFFGLINVDGEPFVIEYNCRMGDPETEVVMPRLESDLVPLLMSLHQGTLANETVVIKPDAAATVMVVSGGYPGHYAKGLPMTLPERPATHTMLFHAGTATDAEGVLRTAGGRVMAATAIAPTIQEAAAKATDAAAAIQFEGRYFRKDIGYEFNA